MKKIISTLFAASFLLAGVASAQGMMGGGWYYGTSTQPDSSAITAALQDIYKAQNVGGQSQIVCSKVTDDQFEKLGDAVMGYGITQQQHSAMENMMGGEGSPTLRQAHINLGRSYLGCWANYNGGPAFMPMMRGFNTYPAPFPGNMMNGFYGNGYGVPAGAVGMMGRGFGWGMVGPYSWLSWISVILVWVLLGLGIAALVKWLRRRS